MMAFLFLVKSPLEGKNISDGLYFTHYNTFNSGLPYDMIYDIIQDGDGFIWIGTSTGVARFDGLHFQSWKRDDLGIGTDFVTSICADENDNVWLATDMGVTVYNKILGKFVPFQKKSNIGTVISNKANRIRRSRDGKIWISVNAQGLFCYDPSKDELENYFFENDKQVFGTNIRALCVDSKNDVYLSLYYNGIYKVSRDRRSLQPILKGQHSNFFDDDDIKGIVSRFSDDNILYVASISRGLCEIDISNGSVSVLVPQPGLGYSPENLFMDSSQRIWMPTTDGVYVYDTMTGETDVLRESTLDMFSLSDSHAWCSYVDRAGGVWIGTNVGGLNYSGSFQKNFEKQYAVNGQSLGDCLVRGIADDRRGSLWITTEKAGLLKYDMRTCSLSRYENPSLPSALLAVCMYDGYLWLGSLKGLYRLDTSSGGVRVFQTLESYAGKSDSNVYALHKTSKGDLLVGTTVGLVRYDSSSDTFVPLKGFDGYFITDIDEDSDGNYWVSTYADGLLKYDSSVDSVVCKYSYDPKKLNGIPANKLFSVLVDYNGDVWGTSFSSGFFRLDVKSGEFQTYSISSTPSLTTNIFFEILQDQSGKMWASSDKGLFRLDPQTGEVRNFTTADGLLNNEFKNCGLRTDDGDLFFGSKNGFIRFSPSAFDADIGDSKIVITGFKVGDEEITTSSPDSPLEKSIDLTEKLSLSSRNNSFGFSFSVPGPESPSAKRVMCFLEGYDSSWRNLDESNSVFYFNVPAGNYRLHLRCSGNYEDVSLGHPVLTISVAQKFYKTPIAIALYFLGILAMAALVFYIMYQRAMKKEMRKSEEFRRAKEDELYREKVAFFSNIVHEIKTPLTLIKTPLNNIMASEGLAAPVKDDLAVINNSMEYLDRLVKELLEFVRIEKHGYVLDIRPLDIVEKLGFICFNFSETAKNNNLKLKFIHSDEKILVHADENAMDKIFNNLIHNAVKYAESYIEIIAERKEGKAVVRFLNDGPSIPMERRTEIFKPFVQFSQGKRQRSQSFGIGLSLAKTLAELHNGNLTISNRTDITEFVLSIPLEAKGESVESIDNLQSDNRPLPLVLIVEDNDSLAAYMRKKLRTDYRILTASSAESAISILQNRDVDLVITDVALKNMSGVDLCRKISQDFELSHIPIIVVSGISSVETKISCMENGASTYIEKPFSLDYLQACMKGILDKRKSLRAAYHETPIDAASVQFDLNNSDEKFLRKLDELIANNLSNPEFSIRNMEDELFLSRSTLIRKVKALLDTTPNDYLKSKRLAAAAKLLSDGNVRVSEICDAVGFNSPSWFAKCFKDAYGVLPLEYRKKCKNEKASNDSSLSD